MENFDVGCAFNLFFRGSQVLDERCANFAELLEDLMVCHKLPDLILDIRVGLFGKVNEPICFRVVIGTS